MSEFVADYPWILLLLGLLIGGVLGAVGAQMFERKKSGGRTVETVQHELDDYKEEVGKHFATTSELFRDMTEKYRDVYNHLSSGSQALCEDEMSLARLEFADVKTVAANNTSAKNPVPDVEDAVKGVPKGSGSGASDSRDDLSSRNEPSLKP